jgi:hypothetical protein
MELGYFISSTPSTERAQRHLHREIASNAFNDLTACNPSRKLAIRKVIMTTRAFLAAILGGIAMFIWSFIAHDLLPLGEMGMREFKNEAAMLDALKTNLGDAGLYHFPGHTAGPNATRQEKSEAMKRAMEKAASGPSGLLIYHPSREFTFGKLLGIEFATELLEGILVVFLLTQTKIESFAGRVGFVLLAGILAAITTNIPYWNWYGFPSNYTAAYMSIEIIGFLWVGLVAALLLKNRSPASATS